MIYDGYMTLLCMWAEFRLAFGAFARGTAVCLAMCDRRVNTTVIKSTTICILLSSLFSVHLVLGTVVMVRLEGVQTYHEL